MGSAIFGNFGIRRLIDQQLRFLRSGGQNDTVFIRYKNFNDNNQPYSWMGFAFTPTASGGTYKPGYTDFLISPPPTIRLVSMHNLGMAAQAGMNLRKGARSLMVSQTFVKAQMQLMGFSEPRQVFEDTSVIGLIVGKNASIVLSIESVFPDYIWGSESVWHLLCNGIETIPGI